MKQNRPFLYNVGFDVIMDGRNLPALVTFLEVADLLWMKLGFLVRRSDQFRPTE